VVDSPAATTTRLEAADALRALATVLVVVIHTTHWPWPAVVFNELDLLSRLAVPAFMMLTGVLLSYRSTGEPVSARTFLRRRFSRSLLPWMVWGPFYAFTGWVLTGDVYPQNLDGLGTFFSYGAGHLWFLLLIPQMYLIYLVWPRRRLWLWAGLAFAVQTALAVYRLYGSQPLAFESQLTLWHGFQLLPFWIGYFAVGLAAGRSLARRGAPRGSHAGIVAAAAAAVVASGLLLVFVTYDSSPTPDFQHGTGAFLLPQEPLYVLSTAVLVLFAAPGIVRRHRGLALVTRVLSENSLGVYILHPIVVYLIAEQIKPLLFVYMPTAFIGFLVLTVAGLTGSTLASMLISATPLAPTLGVRRRRLGLRRVRPASSGSPAG